MKYTPLNDRHLEQLRFRSTGEDDKYLRWYCQWNCRQFMTLFQARDIARWSLKYRGVIVAGIETVEQLTDAIDMLRRWDLLGEPQIVNQKP